MVEYLADQVAVMYVGLLVEVAPTYDLFQSPRHPYTEALMSAVPKTIPKRNPQRIILKGDVAAPAALPPAAISTPAARSKRRPSRGLNPDARWPVIWQKIEPARGKHIQ
jgi:oligopeptide/dipeptide ABC transporter ATP-binding protein